MAERRSDPVDARGGRPSARASAVAVLIGLTDTDDMKDGGVRNLIANNVEERERWPAEAQTIIDEAGAAGAGGGER